MTTVTMSPVVGSTTPLNYTYGQLWQDVGQYLYQTRDSAALTAITGAVSRCKTLANRGYLDFLGQREWTFLQPEATITLVANQNYNDLPSDFLSITTDFSFPANNLKRVVLPTTPQRIKEMRAGVVSTSTDPVWFAVEVQAYSTSGPSYKVLWYPTPSRVLTMYYAYRRAMAAMTDDNQIPAGSPDHGITLLAAALMYAEMDKQVFDGSMAKKYYQVELPRSFQRDASLGAANRGQVTNGARLEQVPYPPDYLPTTNTSGLPG